MFLQDEPFSPSLNPRPVEYFIFWGPDKICFVLGTKPCHGRWHNRDLQGHSRTLKGDLKRVPHIMYRFILTKTSFDLTMVIWLYYDPKMGILMAPRTPFCIPPCPTRRWMGGSGRKNPPNLLHIQCITNYMLNTVYIQYLLNSEAYSTGD